MNSSAVYQKIQEALNALEDYDNRLQQGEKEGAYDKEIRELVPDLLKKSMALLPSGKPCPSCGGTGRT